MISDEAFSKKEHILKSKDFQRAYKKGRRSFVDDKLSPDGKKGALILYSVPNELAHNRIGFSISSRGIKRANVRNRIRRLLKEAYRRNKKYMKGGLDIVIVVKKDLGPAASYKNAEDLFMKFAKKMGILK